MSKSRVPYIDGLDLVSRKRYEEKLSLIDGLDPYEQKEGWSDNIDIFPAVTHTDIFFYLIHTPSVYTQEDLKAWKSLDAINQVCQGWVRENVQWNGSIGDVLALRMSPKENGTVQNAGNYQLLKESDEMGTISSRRHFEILKQKREILKSVPMRFTDVVAKWPGSTHDSVIFQNSELRGWLEANGDGWLLGDSGYPLRTYLMTPKINPQTRQEQAYNLAHSRTRMVVERAFGLLKSRFRCLHKTGGVLQVSDDKAAKLFVVCAKLHNLCVDNHIENPDVMPEQDDGDQTNQQPADHVAVRLRDDLIAQF